MPSLQGARRSRQGFTLLESLIVVAVVALLASAAIPMASKALSTSARKATRAELVQLGVAAQDFFRDTGGVPTSIEELQRGQYLTVPDAAASQPATDFATDAWSRDYRLKRSGDVLAITSAGPDAAADTADDVHILVDFTPIRRELTWKELETIQRAAALYTQRHPADDTLAGTTSSAKRCAPWSETLAALVAGGFLDCSETYRADAWGNPYEARPDGSCRLGRIVSTSIAASLGAARP